MKTLVKFALAATLLTFAGCSKNQSSDVYEGQNLAETSEDSTLTEETPNVEDSEDNDALALDDALLQEFSLNRINDDAFDIETQVTIEFNEEGRIAGNAGCNRYMGSYEITGDGEIRIELAGSTMMMCGDDEMAVEQSILEILPIITEYSIDEASGALTLRTDDGDELAGE